MRINKLLFISALFCLLFTACKNNSTDKTRAQISLQGSWEFMLDTANVGLDEQWFAEKIFVDSLSLPGTTDTNEKGFFNEKTDETSFLSRKYHFVGKAWYKKQVEVPQNWQGKNIRMVLERTKPTQVWIDGNEVGINDNISTSQIYELTDFMTPGKHDIVILVDNGESVPKQLLSNSHAYTESTQTNWNGVIGDMYLEAMEKLHIENLQVYPDVKTRSAKVKVKVSNSLLPDENAKVEIRAEAWNSDKQHSVKTQTYNLNQSTSDYEFDYFLGEDALLWSEYDPALYKLTVTLVGYDTQTLDFGLREFGTSETHFTINGQMTFLRGKHDACVFPLTAHTAMDLESWRNYFRVCKEYGINHCRFHSWCPPKACFQAADIEGIYLQPELPFWGSLQRAEEYLCSFLLKEGINIQNEYGNHASFVLFALGNELSGDLDVMKEFTETFRKIDSRHLYAFGSNNFLGFNGQLEGEDFLVTCRIGGANDYSTHTRGSFSFADAEEGGYINNTYPNTIMDFGDAIAKCSVPVISHETGQFQVYPNYAEMKKYTGVLRPDNFAVFRKRLEETGMLDQAEDFFKASGRWSALLYKADIEMDLRTKGFGGFQLLDLQDYPGQGSAYVGILDAFMDSKELISPEEWREFCNDIVPLFVVEKFCWESQEKLTGQIKIANYSNLSLKGKTAKWTLAKKDQSILDEGEIEISTDENGLLEIGTISSVIATIEKAEELSLLIQISGTNYRNRYPLWIYPSEIELPKDEIIITEEINTAIAKKLEEGKKVLWFPQKEKLESLTVGGLFQTDYWNYRMFKGICEWLNKPVSPGTLGILANPEHPLFNDFPTDYHTNWQWYSIIKQSYPMILDRLPSDFRPIVQVIDNVERNHKLGLIFEFSIGNGKLLVCMSELETVMDKPEAKQLYKSILQYMNSADFNPSTKLTISALTDLFTTKVKSGQLKELKNISYEE